MKMFGLKDYVIEDIKKVLSKYECLEKAAIFGSRAREDYKKTSDIDIAIYAKDITSTTVNMIRNDFDELDIIYKIDVIDYYRISKQALKENIDKEGIVIQF